MGSNKDIRAWTRVVKHARTWKVGGLFDKKTPRNGLV